MQTRPEHSPLRTESVAPERKPSVRAATSHERRDTQLESYFAHVGDAIFVTRLDGRIVDANRAACELLGYSNAQLLTMHPWDFVTSASRDEILDTLQSLQHAVAFTVQRTYRRSDGEELVLDLRLTRFQNDEAANANSANADSDLVIVSCRDVTAHYLAEKALRAAEELARCQVQALTRTLDAMAQESSPDRFLEHMLSTIIEQMGAHNISVWQKAETGGLVGFEYSNMGGDLQDQVRRTRLYNKAIEDNHIWQMMCRSPQIMPYENYVKMAKEGAPTTDNTPTTEQSTKTDPSFRERLTTQGIVTSLVVPLIMTGEMVGCMGVRFKQKRDFRPDELELMQALAHQATLALQLTRLSEQSREAAIVAERDRFARDMHDTLAQSFTGVIVQLEAAQDAAAKGLKQDAENHFQHAGEMARTGLGEARRSVLSLRPQTLNENDLCAALQHAFEYSTRGTSLQAALTTEGNSRALPPHYDEHLLHIGCEALTNALRHARATRFTAQLRFENDTLAFHLHDNGGGFDTTKPRDGLGLRGIGERVAEMRGTLIIESDPTNGTALCIVLPLPDNFGNLHDEHFA